MLWCGRDGEVEPGVSELGSQERGGVPGACYVIKGKSVAAITLQHQSLGPWAQSNWMLWGGRRPLQPMTAPCGTAEMLQWPIPHCQPTKGGGSKKSEGDGPQRVRKEDKSWSKDGSNQSNGGGPLSKGEARPTEGPLEDLFPLWFFCTSCLPHSLQFLSYPCTQSQPERTRAGGTMSGGPFRRQAWGPRRTRGSANIPSTLLQDHENQQLFEMLDESAG